MDKENFAIKVKHVRADDSINITIRGKRIGVEIQCYYDDTDSSQIIRVQKTEQIGADPEYGLKERTEWNEGFLLADDSQCFDKGELG
jgi:hypothetical protein